MMYQASKKTDFTVDLIWRGSLRLTPMITVTKVRYLVLQFCRCDRPNGELRKRYNTNFGRRKLWQIWWLMTNPLTIFILTDLLCKGAKLLMFFHQSCVLAIWKLLLINPKWLV